MRRADGAIGNAETGQAYTNGAGTAAIASNEGYFSTDANGNRVYLDSGVGNGRFSLDLKGEFDVGTSNYRIPALTFRGSGDNTHLYAQIGYNSLLILFKMVAGTPSSLGTVSFVPSDDTYYSLAARAVNDVIQVFVDGVLLLTRTLSAGDYTTFPATNGLVGVRLVKGGTPSVAARFKNLAVWDSA